MRPTLAACLLASAALTAGCGTTSSPPDHHPTRSVPASPRAACARIEAGIAQVTAGKETTAQLAGTLGSQLGKLPAGSAAAKAVERLTADLAKSSPDPARLDADAARVKAACRHVR